MQEIYQIVGFLVVFVTVIISLSLIAATISYIFKRGGVKAVILLPIKLVVIAVLFIPVKVFRLG